MSQVTDDYVMTEFNRIREILRKQTIEIEALKKQVAQLQSQQPVNAVAKVKAAA